MLKNSNAKRWLIVLLHGDENFPAPERCDWKAPCCTIPLIDCRRRAACLRGSPQFVVHHPLTTSEVQLSGFCWRRHAPCSATVYQLVWLRYFVYRDCATSLVLLRRRGMHETIFSIFPFVPLFPPSPSYYRLDATLGRSPP